MNPFSRKKHSGGLWRLPGTMMTMILLGVLSSTTEAYKFLLQYTASKCVAVDLLGNSQLKISYFIPDMQEEADLLKAAQIHDEEEEGIDPEQDNLDEQKKKLDKALKRARTGKDVTLAINQRSLMANYHRESAGERPKSLRESLKEREGVVHFETGEQPGIVDICVRSIYANRKNPYLVHMYLHVENEYDEDYWLEQEANRIAQEEAERRHLQSSQMAEQSKEILSHFSGFTKEMIRAQTLAKQIVNSADQLQGEDAAFSEHSTSMHRTVQMWPMIQMFILLVATVFQVRYIMNFLQSKRIVL